MQEANMEIKLCSSLEKIFDYNKNEIPECRHLYLLSGEDCFFQIIIQECTGLAEIDITGADSYELYEVKDVQVNMPVPPDAVNCTLLNDGKIGMYPDLLVPLNENKLICDKTNKTVFVKIAKENLSCGFHSLKINVTNDREETTNEIKIFVSYKIIEDQSLIYTNWFHCDCLAEYYNTPVFSEKHWQIIDNFMKNAADYGMNCILTPLFTPPLDTAVGGERPTVQLVDVAFTGRKYKFGFSKLKRYISLAFKNGIKYIEFSHLFTQWGAEHAPKIIAETPTGKEKIFGWETDSCSESYKEFLKQLGSALKEFTDNEGITDICFIHCSDEPGKEDFEKYKNASNLIKKYFGAYRHIDALSDTEFFDNGLVQIPVPEIGSIQKFVNKTDNLWTYYCCGQYKNELPNRFIAFPSIKNRIIGVLLYKYNCSGFLHWGYNFYFSQYSLRKIDPFKENDAGSAFSAGDSFIVYPGEKLKPLPSLRQFVFYEGLCDFRALKTVEKLYSREYALDLINQIMGEIDFHNYPLDNSVLLRLRQEIYKKIENYSEGD